ncbi:DUF3572 domain-containing protein [Sphingomonas sinipercae]|uniref:DUF3572 domain-containing protein n=1 Tax=Sphingomonas sinipercae TaxID=2714944 RepID=A0A6G7ZKM0_9SPHN|nr:DUF3572 family protein [Sphingomonas sinipercae]QIL01483.1 DUF3572 domain-containing protein [Sphingomonas sinipercae]
MPSSSPTDATALALTALAATLSDERKAQRFLELSGLSPDEMRARAAEPALLAAFLAFLEAHEPDLLAVAGEIGCSAQALVKARRTLEEEQ